MRFQKRNQKMNKIKFENDILDVLKRHGLITGEIIPSELIISLDVNEPPYIEINYL